MKYLVKFFVVTLIALICTHASAEQKIATIDMKYILNNSKAGKGAQDYLKKTFKENQEKYISAENQLKKAESDLLGKKASLSKEEYTKNANDLRKKVIKHQQDKRASLDKITKQRSIARQTLLKELDPILKSYVEENSLSLVLDKKTVLAGNTNLDITEAIVEKLNKALPSLNLK